MHLYNSSRSLGLVIPFTILVTQFNWATIPVYRHTFSADINGRWEYQCMNNRICNRLCTCVRKYIPVSAGATYRASVGLWLPGLFRRSADDNSLGCNPTIAPGLPTHPLSPHQPVTDEPRMESPHPPVGFPTPNSVRYTNMPFSARIWGFLTPIWGFSTPKWELSTPICGFSTPNSGYSTIIYKIQFLNSNMRVLKWLTRCELGAIQYGSSQHQ